MQERTDSRFCTLLLTMCFIAMLILVTRKPINAQSITQSNENVVIESDGRHWVYWDTSHFFFLGYNPYTSGMSTTCNVHFWYVYNGQTTPTYYYGIFTRTMPGTFQGPKSWGFVKATWDECAASMPPPGPGAQMYFKYVITSVIYYVKNGVSQSMADTWNSGVWIKTLP